MAGSRHGAGGSSRPMRATRRAWKQSKTQHKKLLRGASERENAPPAKVAAVRVAGLKYVTTAWLQRHAPQISSLSVSAGEQRAHLKALVANRERQVWVDYSPTLVADFDSLDRILRRREEAGLLELASGPERAAAKRARQEEKARLKRQLAPERERKAKLRRAERRRQRRLGEPEEDVAEEPRPDDYDSDAAYEAYLARIAANPPFARRCS